MSERTAVASVCCGNCGKVISKETTLNQILDFVASAEAAGWTFSVTAFADRYFIEAGGRPELFHNRFGPETRHRSVAQALPLPDPRPLSAAFAIAKKA